MQRFKNILFIIGREEKQEDSFARAVELAEHNRAELTVLDVLEGMDERRIKGERRLLAGQLMEIIRKERLARIEQLITPIRAKETIKVYSKVTTGKLFMEVIKEVLRDGHDLVIKSAAPQHGLKSKLRAGPDMHLLRKCPCPVWIIKPGAHARYQEIMAAVDVHPLDGDHSTEELNRQILEMASSLAVTESAGLRIAHAYRFFAEDFLWSDTDAPFSELDAEKWRQEDQESCRTKLEKLATSIPLVKQTLAAENERLTIDLASGDPKEVIPRLAHEKHIDLVVMGTVSRSGISGFFIGNTAESILHDIDCSVLAIKPPGFVSPVELSKFGL